MLSLVVLILCAIPAILFFFKFRWDKEDADLGLTGPPTIPLFGNSLQMRKANKEDGDCKWANYFLTKSLWLNEELL